MAIVGNVVVDIDKGMRKFLASINGMKNIEVAIGVHSGSMNTEGEDLATIAIANEFGVPSRKVPSRPFMATTFAAKSGRVNSMLDSALSDITYRGIPPYVALGRVGQRYQEWIVETISRWTTPPNAPSTIKQKGRNEPLRDTYSMMKSIRWVVRQTIGGANVI